jgi:hypothetical protein
VKSYKADYLRTKNANLREAWSAEKTFRRKLQAEAKQLIEENAELREQRAQSALIIAAQALKDARGWVTLTKTGWAEQGYLSPSTQKAMEAVVAALDATEGE